MMRYKCIRQDAVKLFRIYYKVQMMWKLLFKKAIKII